MTGILGITELGAQSVLLHFTELFYAIPEGSAAAATIRIGLPFGSKSITDLKIACHLSTVLQTIAGIITALIYVVFRYQLVTIFKNDKRILILAFRMTIYVALNDLMCFISHGPLSILRGAGRMTFAAIATLIPFNVISLPLAAYLMYVRHWRLSGYWKF